MKKENIKNKIKKFIRRDDISRVDFWLDLFPSTDITPKIKNIEKPDQELVFLSEGIYDFVAEIDLRKCSFNALSDVAKEENINSDFKNTLDAIKELIEEHKPEPHPLKQLRIYFFECLLNTDFRFYNPDLYLKTREKMLQRMNKLEEIIKSHGKPIICSVYDSISFISSRDEANEIVQEVPFPVKMDYFKRMVKFRNIVLYNKDGERFTKKTTGTSYDPIKNEVVDALMELDFEKARNIIKNTRINDKLKESYLESIDKMEEKR